jgi:hypothetical protein
MTEHSHGFTCLGSVRLGAVPPMTAIHDRDPRLNSGIGKASIDVPAGLFDDLDGRDREESWPKS